MLNFIYYPVSAILWFWHKIFGFVLGPANGIAWALSVIFLVFTLRVLLFKPFVNQVKTQRQMQEFQPQIKALQKKYSGDKQKLAVEMQKLQKENGFNPISGCLPVLAQAPVFIGLYHVLRSFNRTVGGIGQIKLTPEVNRTIPNYVFDVSDVNSFLDAKLFGAPLSASIRSSSDQLLAFGPDISKASIVAVAVPLMVIAAIATHFTARASVSRQAANPTAAAAPQAAIMNKLVVWVFPFFVLFGGPFLPLAILLYWLANNGWTLAQQHYVFGKLAKEEELKKSQAQDRRTASAPRPGAKPTTMTKTRKPKLEKSAADSENGANVPTSGAVEESVSLSKDDAEGVRGGSAEPSGPAGGARSPGPGGKRGSSGARRQGPGGPPRKSAPGARGGPPGGKRGSTPGNSPRKKR